MIDIHAWLIGNREMLPSYFQPIMQVLIFIVLQNDVIWNNQLTFTILDTITYFDDCLNQIWLKDYNHCNKKERYYVKINIIHRKLLWIFLLPFTCKIWRANDFIHDWPIILNRVSSEIIPANVSSSKVFVSSAHKRKILNLLIHP